MARQSSWSRRIGGIVLLTIPLACGGQEDDSDSGTSCVGAKCDFVGGSVAELLEGRNEPIANALRKLAEGESPIVRLPTREELDVQAIEDAGGADRAVAVVLDAPAAEGFPGQTGSYLALLDEAAKSNCGTTNTIQSYVIADDLVADAPSPRVITVTCADDQRKASNAFVALSFTDDAGDVDARSIEAFGWDATTRIFQFYRSIPLEDSDEGVLMVINPEKLEGEIGGCLGCHRGPAVLSADDADLVPALPIMNEIVEPWSHWNAEPGFRSQMFEVPNASNMPRYQSLTTKADGRIDPGDWLAGADRFEIIIRDGFGQVVKERRKRLSDPAEVSKALGLLRPLFCEEQLNYSSEVGISGELALGSVVDEGIRRSIVAANIGANWVWATGTEARVLIAPASSPSEALELVPMRGQSAIAWEEALVTSLQKFLSPQQSLQIRALDWQTPVFSDFRCELFDRVASAPMPIGSAANNHAAMLSLLSQMLVLPGGVEIKASKAANIVVLDDASKADALAGDLQAGTVPVVECMKGSTCDLSACDEKGYCEMNLWAFGERINAYVKDFQSADGRARLTNVRRERLCRVKSNADAFPMAPALPKDFSCN